MTQSVGSGDLEIPITRGDPLDLLMYIPGSFGGLQSIDRATTRLSKSAQATTWNRLTPFFCNYGNTSKRSTAAFWYTCLPSPFLSFVDVSSRPECRFGRPAASLQSSKHHSAFAPTDGSDPRTNHYQRWRMSESLGRHRLAARSNDLTAQLVNSPPQFLSIQFISLNPLSLLVSVSPSVVFDLQYKICNL